MPITFRCGGCQTRLSIGTHKAGTPIRCPKCKAALTVPAAPETPERIQSSGPGRGNGPSTFANLAGATAAPRQESSSPEVCVDQRPPTPAGLPLRYLAAGIGLALMLCIGAYVIASSLGD